MFKSGWSVVGLGVAFLIVQSCGDDMGTGRIVSPGADPQQQEELYDDGRVYWDGSDPMLVENWKWEQGASEFRGQYGQRLTVRCVPDGTEMSVFGTNPFSDDSSVCTAGAHAGLVDRSTGGSVTIEIRPAQKHFDGAVQNGVTGFSRGPYPGSFVLVR